MYPPDDAREHDLESYGCACRPAIKHNGNVIHRAFDKRPE